MTISFGEMKSSDDQCQKPDLRNLPYHDRCSVILGASEHDRCWPDFGAQRDAHT